MLLDSAQFLPTEMYGRPRYRRRADTRILDFTVWTGLSHATFVVAETPAIREALGRCRVVREVSYETDGFGFKKTDFPVAPGVPTVLFLGDSFTEGLHVRSEDTFVNLFGRRMREAGLQAVPVNGGVNGYGTLEEDWLAESLAARLDSRVVIENLFPNDAGDQKDVLADSGPGRHYDEMFEYLERLADFCSRSRIELVVSVIPSVEQIDAPHAAFQHRVQRWCAHRRTAFLDALPYLRSHGGRANYFSWDAHFNEEGHRQYADYLWQALPSLPARFAPARH